jgi:hypothetical protein
VQVRHDDLAEDGFEGKVGEQCVERGMRGTLIERIQRLPQVLGTAGQGRGLIGVALRLVENQAGRLCS